MTHIKGIVKWFNNTKGYGFIRSDDGTEVFVHYSAINSDGYRTLQQHEEVEFEIAEGPKGRPQAANVKKRCVLTHSNPSLANTLFRK